MHKVCIPAVLFTALIACSFLSVTSNPSSGLPADLEFILGTWKTHGMQFWPDGTWVQHKGVVIGRRSKDGLEIEREFWGAFENGHSLGGRSVHRFDEEERSWTSRWIPTAGTWDASPAVGGLDGDDFVEVGTGRDARGEFTSRARFFEVSPSAYRVQADLTYKSGEVSTANWTIQFERVSKVESAPMTATGSIEFLVGAWLVEGTLLQPSGQRVTHRSYVDARLAADGQSVEREYWGALSNGSALRGISSHRPSATADQWSVAWTPTGAAASTRSSVGRFEQGEFVERESTTLPTGPAVIRTRNFDITPVSYSVQTDILHENGEVSEAVWTARFQRIE